MNTKLRINETVLVTITAAGEVIERQGKITSISVWVDGDVIKTEYIATDTNRYIIANWIDEQTIKESWTLKDMVGG